jgi:predicted SAM-dependent methyltransferase
MKKLNLGCGKDIKEGFVNLDSVKNPGVDIVHDLNKTPWPLKDNEFDYIFASSTIEHLDNLILVMEEIHRICKNKARIEIIVPHFSSLGAYIDPTHKKFFSYYSFDYFTNNFDYNFYTEVRFNIIKRKIVYGKGLFFFEGIANLFPKIHEVLLRKFLPVKDIYFLLEVLKEK